MEYQFVRRLIDTEDVEYLQERNGKTCFVKFYSCEDIDVLRGDYDTLSIQLNDAENAMEEEEEDDEKSEFIEEKGESDQNLQ